MLGRETIMATRYGRTFTTRRGRRGRYKYVNGRKVSFVLGTGLRGTGPRRKTSYKKKRFTRYRRY